MSIYTITNRLNGKVYVGQCVGRVRRRWSNHNNPKSGSGRTAIKNAIQLYGKESFDYRVLDLALSREELNKKEIYWINELGSLAPQGYNLRTGGSSPIYTEESKSRMSAARRAYFVRIGWTPKPKQAKPERKKRVWSEDERVRRASTRPKYTHTSESKDKISASKMRKVVRSDGKEFNSITDAANSVGRNTSTLNRLLRGNTKRHTCGGFSWKYLTHE